MPARILLVEDSPEIIEYVAVSLRQDGHEVIACTDGVQAIRLLKSGDFDLMICDLLMPEANGLEVLLALKKRVPPIRTIVITGADPIHQQSARDFGADLVLTKPFKLDQLSSAVSEMVPA